MRVPGLLLVLLLACFTAKAEADTPEQIARQIILPRLEFKDATAREGVDYLRRKSVELTAGERGLNINITGSREEVDGAMLTCSYRNAPLLEVLQFIAYQTKMTLAANDTGIYLYSPGQLPPGVQGLHDLSWTDEKMKAYKTTIFLMGRRDGYEEAQKMIENAFGDRFKASKEARDLLDALKQRVDEDKKRLEEASKKLESPEAGVEKKEK
jgi:hypothetical protein